MPVSVRFLSLFVPDLQKAREDLATVHTGSTRYEGHLSLQREHFRGCPIGRGARLPARDSGPV